MILNSIFFEKKYSLLLNSKSNAININIPQENIKKNFTLIAMPVEYMYRLSNLNNNIKATIYKIKNSKVTPVLPKYF